MLEWRERMFTDAHNMREYFQAHITSLTIPTYLVMIKVWQLSLHTWLYMSYIQRQNKSIFFFSKFVTLMSFYMFQFKDSGTSLKSEGPLNLSAISPFPSPNSKKGSLVQQN